MRICLAKMLSVSVFTAALTLSGPTVAKAAEADDQVLAELNFAREHPREYADLLIREPVSPWERALAPDPASQADAVAYAQAIDFLKRQTPLPPLRADDHLTAAALEHVAAQGPAGKIGHDGPAGERFDARLRRHGVEAQVWAENIAYGPKAPRDVVRELIIDRGVPDRGHRRNIFLASVQAAGVSCGPHRDFDSMCVIDFANPSRLPEATLQLVKFEPAKLEPQQLAPTTFELATVELATLDLQKAPASSEGLLRRWLHSLLG